MAAGISDFGAFSWLSALFGVTSPITGYYVALASEEPGVASDGVILADLEPVDPGAYARQPYGVGPTNWGLNGNTITNLVEIDFGTPLVDWGLVSHYVLCTDPTAGDIYGFGVFLNPQTVSAGFDLTIPAGGLVFTLGSLDDSITP